VLGLAEVRIFSSFGSKMEIENCRRAVDPAPSRISQRLSRG